MIGVVRVFIGRDVHFVHERVVDVTLLLENTSIGWMADWDRTRASRVPPHHMQIILRGLGRHGDIRVLCNDSFGNNSIMPCQRATRSRSTAIQP